MPPFRTHGTSSIRDTHTRTRGQIEAAVARYLRYVRAFVYEFIARRCACYERCDNRSASAPSSTHINPTQYWFVQNRATGLNVKDPNQLWVSSVNEPFVRRSAQTHSMRLITLRM